MKWATNMISSESITCNTNVQVLENLAKLKRVICKPKAILFIANERIYTLMEYQ